MSRHRLTIEIDVDDDALLDSMPSVDEWDMVDLRNAIADEIVIRAEIVDYETVLGEAEARAAVEADARARAAETS